MIKKKFNKLTHVARASTFPLVLHSVRKVVAREKDARLKDGRFRCQANLLTFMTPP